MSEKNPQDPLENQQPGDDDFSRAPAAQSHTHFAQDRPSPWVWISLGFLVVVALAVIFVLPDVVSRYELPLTPRSTEVETPQPAQPARQPGQQQSISPFQAAQLAAQRQQAQDVLAELLEVEARLEQLEVERWGGDAYQGALENAGLGDEAYRSQDFLAARDYYILSRDAMQSELDRVPQILEENLESGEAALAADDDSTALEHFNLALVLDGDSERAAIGKARAETLTEVNALVDEAEALREDGELEAARNRYREAVDLDSYHEIARSGLEEVTAAIAQRDFSRAMSEGYARLQADEPDLAIAAFRRALAMGVNDEQARAAITQTGNEVAAAKIAGFRQDAEAAREEESWADAIAAYERALEVDPNVVFAVDGLDYARKRERLDGLLEFAIDNPERFNDEAVFEETLDIYYTGRAIENPGPRLTAQLDKLEALLQEAQEPVNVTFVSNDETQVTLLRTYDLGEFQEQIVPLKPGRYVAVGTRRGYRDVRKEFVVGFGQTPETVVVQCDERVIASTGN